MDADGIRRLLEGLQRGEVDVEAALDELKRLPFSDLGFARIDHHRALRQGAPEVVLGSGKSPAQIQAIAKDLAAAGENVLVTRVDADKAARVREELPELRYNPIARTLTLELRPVANYGGKPVALVTAGTSDVPVAEEAAETLQLLGVPVDRIYDVGVAGIHRLFGELDRLATAPACIVAAGMEGALASVVGGLVAAPVIAVPTSIGYGVGAGGYAALLGMLSCCAAGVTVVNIDNGFGAAMAVARMVKHGPGDTNPRRETAER
ncbi:MAG: nickel pincer cofactor biosynthesis protein LarB [Myxococcales bacterium]|jgi:NCAIR mutase (PurE)-related protein|nr:nickel pincer cofactor biosynthesis protein LarB [Myxococcales bacterium]